MRADILTDILHLVTDMWPKRYFTPPAAALHASAES